MVSVEDVAAVPIFSSLDPDQLGTIANWFDAEEVGEGVKLVGEGCHGYSFFVLAEGTASVTAEGEELATLRAGDFFGEVAMLDSGRRTASVTSTAPARLFVMFGTEFRQLQDAYLPRDRRPHHARHEQTPRNRAIPLRLVAAVYKDRGGR